MDFNYDAYGLWVVRREGKWGGLQAGTKKKKKKKKRGRAIKTNHERMSEPGLPEHQSWRASQISLGPNSFMLWGQGGHGLAMFFWHSHLYLWPKNTWDAHKGEKEGTMNCPPLKRQHCRQREVRNQEMSPINRMLWARRGVEGGNSAVCGEHATGYKIRQPTPASS